MEKQKQPIEATERRESLMKRLLRLVDKAEEEETELTGLPEAEESEALTDTEETAEADEVGEAEETAEAEDAQETPAEESVEETAEAEGAEPEDEEEALPAEDVSERIRDLEAQLAAAESRAESAEQKLMEMERRVEEARLEGEKAGRNARIGELFEEGVMCDLPLGSGGMAQSLPEESIFTLAASAR